MKTIRVLMYHGPYGRSTGYEKSLRYCNRNQLLPGFRFACARADRIDDSILKARNGRYRYDVVMYPGGNYKQGRDGEGCNVADVRRFLRQGGGYYGTCGGCGAAIGRIMNRDGSTYANSPDGRSLQLLPQLQAEQGWYSGYFCGFLTAAGTRITGYGGEQISMVAKGLYLFYPKAKPNSHVDLLHPANNHRGSRGRMPWPLGKEPFQAKYDTARKAGEQKFRSLVTARFGRGRVIVGQTHVESFAKGGRVWYPRWVGGGVLWAAGYEPPFASYVLGSDRGEHATEVQDKGLRRLHQSIVAQRELVTHRGRISALRILHVGKGELSMQLFTGSQRPGKALFESSPLVIRDPRRQWLTFELPNPLVVNEGDKIWLGARMKNKGQALYCRRYESLGKDTLERKAFATKPMDCVVSMYAVVNF